MGTVHDTEIVVDRWDSGRRGIERVGRDEQYKGAVHLDCGSGRVPPVSHSSLCSPHTHGAVAYFTNASPCRPPLKLLRITVISTMCEVREILSQNHLLQTADDTFRRGGRSLPVSATSAAS
jgi:hypothetical protein